MKYATEMDSGCMTYIPRFIMIGSGIRINYLDNFRDSNVGNTGRRDL
jgi:hypothetical protein